MSGPSGQYPLSDLLECAGLARSSHHCALAHPKGPTRPELRDAAAEIFSRTANGCGHRQIAMCPRAERGAAVADKTVPETMRGTGIRCGIRRETDHHRHDSYKGAVGRTFENVVGRDFGADGPWEKMGTDVTESGRPWGKAYSAPVYDFGSKGIVAWSTSTHPNMAQQHELLDQLMSKRPEGARPTLHSDMGWRYQHAEWCGRLEEAGICRACPGRATASTTARRSRCSGTRGTSSSGTGCGRASMRSRGISTPTSSTGTREGGRSN